MLYLYHISYCLIFVIFLFDFLFIYLFLDYIVYFMFFFYRIIEPFYWDEMYNKFNIIQTILQYIGFYGSDNNYILFRDKPWQKYEIWYSYWYLYGQKDTILITL